MKNSKILNTLTTFLFYLSVLFFLIAFNFQDSKTGGWYQQFLPSPLGGQLEDIYFVDSLLGFAVSDSCILKTTNGGDNWIQKLNGYYLFQRVQFLNSNTGFACAGNNKLLKSTNSGDDWIIITLPMDLYPRDMSVLNSDTVWLVDSESLTGGAFLTTNGGTNWQVKYSQQSANPSHIYMYNARIGFMDGGGLKKTTNGGDNWISITTEGQFTDMYFVDSLMGWKCYGGVKKTTNGGINWIAQSLPSGGNIIVTGLSKFSNINKDTIWGIGGTVFFGGGQYRGMIYRTTNSGNNWYYQLPDTSVHIPVYYHNKFINKLKGWAYSISNGVHTIVGGDSLFVMSANQNISNISNEYKLEQNYPNPFNSIAKIKYKIEKTSNIKIIVFDISGKEIEILVNKKQSPGEYEVKFDGTIYGGLSSGIYFYSLLSDGIRIDTKKMVLIK